jgi:hypothetical protein
MSLQQQQRWKLDKPRSSVLRHIAVLEQRLWLLEKLLIAVMGRVVMQGQ